jgi:hypothetical protein
MVYVWLYRKIGILFVFHTLNTAHATETLLAKGYPFSHRINPINCQKGMLRTMASTVMTARYNDSF